MQWLHRVTQELQFNCIFFPRCIYDQIFGPIFDLNRFWLHVTKLWSARTRPAGCQCARHTGLRARVAFTTPVCVCVCIFSFLKPSVSLINALTHFLVFSTRVFGVSARACTSPHTHTEREGRSRFALRVCASV